MRIKTDLPWPLKAAVIGVVLGLGGAVAMWAYDLGRDFAGFGPGINRQQLTLLKEQVEKLSAERDQLSVTVNAAESRFNIERSAQKQLAAQVKTLETENARLKEDLAFFESLLPADTGQGVAIRRLATEWIAPNQIRYRLLVMQGGKGNNDFVGNLQFALTVVQGGKNAMMIFPQGNSSDTNKFKLSFKHYQRVEGVLTLPEGISVKAIQARVLEKGQIRAQQSANL
jgi:outer membrane murein-binding lipoprotein Lpp